MFTIKLYSGPGERQVILAADSFTILRDKAGGAEITLHQKGGDSTRYDVGADIGKPTRPEGFPPVFDRAIIENAQGKTTEIISQRPI
jgi:hypothetical protein